MHLRLLLIAGSRGGVDVKGTDPCGMFMAKDKHAIQKLNQGQTSLY